MTTIVGHSLCVFGRPIGRCMFATPVGDVQKGLNARSQNDREHLHLLAVAALYKDAGAGTKHGETQAADRVRPKNRLRVEDHQGIPAKHLSGTLDPNALVSWPSAKGNEGPS